MTVLPALWGRASALPPGFRPALLLLLLLTGDPTFGQSFEAASIRPNHSVGEAGVLKPAPGGLMAQNLSLKSYIQWAWNREEYEVIFPPSLKEIAKTAHYDIEARSPEKSSTDETRLMLRTLLLDRFHLAVHTEKKDIRVLALVVAKGGPKNLRQPAPDEKTYTEPQSTDAEGQHWVLHNVDMKNLAGFLSKPGLEGPVIDTTGLSGRFTFDFTEPPWNRAEEPFVDYVLGQVFPEVQRQLGLKVQGQNVPMDVLVIDRADSTPGEN